MVTTKPSEPTVGVVIATVYDTETQEVEVLTEKIVEISENSIPKIEEIFPTTKISQSVYKEIIKKDANLQNVITKVTQSIPKIDKIEPTSVVVDKFGHKSVYTVAYKEEKIVTVVETSDDES